MMKRTSAFLASSVWILAFVIGGICNGAEKRGFVLPELAETATDTRTTPVTAGTMPQPVYQTEPSDEAFIETYANEKEIERLKKLLEKRNRENAVLKEKLTEAVDRGTKLEMRIYKMESETVPQYEVRKGDSLWRIAKRTETYGDPRLWIKIFNANMDRIKNPNVIFPGQLLRIPK
jgi:nucleoid-associated protein YgaU